MAEEKPLRDRLIDAGVELVLSEGTSAVGLREIARRAGVSHGAPRRYFPTHHALLSAIAKRGFEDLAARFAAVTQPSAPPREQLRALGRAYVYHALEHRGMFELMFRHDLLDSERHDPSDRPRLREATLPVFGLLVDLVAHERPGPAPAVTAAALWSNLHGIAQLWAWGSLPLVVGDTDGRQLDRLLTAALDAHLGPVST
ncbi:TetR/AcrR family transcriptional regulator [Streptomyces sp. NPDC047821]|uniref:TetR/AcrR family transcriptional regulator n=1 Tax=Streptomyces sp. NPDC047821 TaxID=3365488 RepID=UPI00371F8D9E